MTAACFLIKMYSTSNRQLRIPPSTQPGAIYDDADIRTHNRHIPCEGGDGAQEVAEQDHDAVKLDAEADERPPQQDEDQAAEEGRGAFRLLLAREEEEGLGGPDYDGQAYEEEDLSSGVGAWVSM